MTQRYQDVQGKVGVKDLRGSSGRTYGDTRFFTQEELDTMLADGIRVQAAPPPPVITPEELERRRQRAIRSDSWHVGGVALYNDVEQGSTINQVSNSELIVALADLAIAAIPHSAERPDSIIKLIEDAAILRDSKAVVDESIATGRTVEEHDQAMLDMLNTDHPERAEKVELRRKGNGRKRTGKK